MYIYNTCSQRVVKDLFVCILVSNFTQLMADGVLLCPPAFKLRVDRQLIFEFGFCAVVTLYYACAGDPGNFPFIVAKRPL